MAIWKRLCASVAAAATLLGLAIGASVAMADDTAASTDGTITITTANAETDTFQAYLLGTYVNPQVSGNQVTSVDLQENPAWSDAIADSLNYALGDQSIPQAYTGNELTYVTTAMDENGAAATDATRRVFADRLFRYVGTQKAAAIAPTSVNTKSEPATVTFTGLTPGYYMVTETVNGEMNGTPMLVGTNIVANGQSYSNLNGEELGVATAKPQKPSGPKKTVANGDGSPNDGTTYWGEKLKYSIKLLVPGTSNREVTMQVEDTASKGLQIPTQASDFSMAITDANGNAYTGGVKPVLSIVSQTGDAAQGTTTTLQIANVKGLDGYYITVSYLATVTPDAPVANTNNVSDATKQPSATNVAKISHDGGANWSAEGDPVKTNTYGFSFTKTDRKSGEPLAGATFAITGTGKNYTQPVTMTTSADNNDTVTFNGLAAGVYTVTETQVPDGYVQNIKPSFNVQITQDGTVLISKNDAFGLVSLNNGKMTVQNVTSIAQLPLTGAAGITMIALMALVLALIAILILWRSRSLKKQMNA
ncbi:SpaA isopeptide-forming pilin-related protein [Bifidobacterium dolichotidis]|nr:SpaA isopeptide-forming pilin-related protein [Bifidobacterium dolichotidis]